MPAALPTTRSIGSTNCFLGDMFSGVELRRSADAHNCSPLAALVISQWKRVSGKVPVMFMWFLWLILIGMLIGFAIIFPWLLLIYGIVIVLWLMDVFGT